MRIQYTISFKKRYEKLPLGIKIHAESKTRLFKENPFHSSLKTHKLHGKMKEFWGFSVSYDYRIIFEFMDDSSVRFNDIGTHKMYE